MASKVRNRVRNVSYSATSACVSVSASSRRVCIRPPEPPPPEQFQPCRRPVPSHPSCPCAAVRAGGPLAASSAGQPLARGGQQRAGWQQGGMGWADAVGGKGRLISLSPTAGPRVVIDAPHHREP